MIILNVDNLSLSFGTKPILEHITFALNEGDRLGIIGINGCGDGHMAMNFIDI